MPWRWPWSIAGREGELLHHSDRGGQYASDAYQRLRRTRDRAEHEPAGELLGQRGDGELLRTPKSELIHHEPFATREEARGSIFEYIEVFYNRQRLHSTLGYRSPERVRGPLRT